MNVINVGFNSRHWNVMVEASDEYKLLSEALDDDNPVVATHIMNTINSLLSNEDGAMNNAYREAHSAVKASDGMDTGGGERTTCPFCQGEGILEFEIADPNDPSRVKEEWVDCNACKGQGSIETNKLFNEYSGSALPEHVVMAVIRGNMVEARDIAKAVMSDIMSYESDNLERSG